VGKTKGTEHSVSQVYY